MIGSRFYTQRIILNVLNPTQDRTSCIQIKAWRVGFQEMLGFEIGYSKNSLDPR